MSSINPNENDILTKMRRLRWRKLMKTLMVIGIVTLLIFIFRHSEDLPVVDDAPLHHQRRIQEVTRLMVAKGADFTPDLSGTYGRTGENGGIVGNVGNGRIVNLISPPKRYGRASADKAVKVFNSNYSLPFLEISKMVLEKYGYNRSVVEAAEQRNEMLVVTLKANGKQMTAKQKQLYESIPVDKKSNMFKNLSSMQKKAQHWQFNNLRKKGQIKSLPSGGEKLIATSILPVRFPMQLKSIRPEDWTDDYKLFRNLTYYPWRQPECKEFHTLFAPVASLKTTALASFPSSGNSWLRYLIECSSGIFTGSMYDDFSLIRKGYYGEGVVFDSGMTIVQKSHGYTSGDFMRLAHHERVLKNHMGELSNQGIVVIRNPFKAIISHRHLDVGGHTGFAPMSHFQGKGWRDFVLLKIKLWREFYIDWLNAARPQDIHIVFYEDLKLKTDPVLRRILKFLHLPVDNKRMQCLFAHPDGTLKRKASPKIPTNSKTYTNEMKLQIYKAIQALSDELVVKGERPLPVHNYEYFDPKEAIRLMALGRSESL